LNYAYKTLNYSIILMPIPAQNLMLLLEPLWKV